MFKMIDNEVISSVDIKIDGKGYAVPRNMTVAAAALYCGLPSVRETPVTGAGRLPLCMMGVCFDCLMIIDGVDNQRACQVVVQDGMEIERQIGAAEFRGEHEEQL
jgi:D-hydroxyproline dehydrogenase subunit gamma